MDWYYALTEHLLDKDKFINRNTFEYMRVVLENKVVVLYKAILLYQIMSICSYYRNQGLVFLRGLVDLDKWDGLLSSVKNSENDVQVSSEKYNNEVATKSMTALVRLTEGTTSKLGDIHEDLQRFIKQQGQIQMKSENKECLGHLFLVNPQDAMTAIERDEEGGLVDDAYEWILKDEKYAIFTNWDESVLSSCRLLWVKGDTGTGKTMLLMGIIRQLSKQLAMFAPTISYFFCRGKGKSTPLLNNATATMRSLIWMLLIQQPGLIWHLKDDPSFFTAAGYGEQQYIGDYHSSVQGHAERCSTGLFHY